MATGGETKSETNEHFEWNVENEIYLFEAMIGYKPVGIHKHFHMACICEKFETLLGKSVSPDIIWDHLRNMYDLAALDKKETIPFPNDIEEFALPRSDFSELMAEKLSKTEKKSEMPLKDEKSTPKLAKEPAQGNGVSKKDKKLEQEESSAELEKKEMEEHEVDGKRGKIKKEDKIITKRGKRNLKDKKTEDESLQVSAPSVKKGDEETSATQGGKRKGKRMIGKRSLRTRADDTSSSKSSTPPPIKRPRRI